MQDHKRLNDAIEDYLSIRRARLAEASSTNESFVVRRFAAWYGDVQVRHMRPERVAEWFYGPGGLMQEHRTRDGQWRKPIAPTTHNYYRTRLASLFRFLTQRGWLRRDLLADVEPLRVMQRQRQQPPPEVLLALLDAASNARDRAYLATTLNTALRSREVCALRVGDVDLAAGDLAVTIFKTHQQDTMPITADLDVELKRWLREYALDLARPLNARDFLFPARTGPRYRWEVQPNGERRRTQSPPSWQPTRQLSHSERIVQSAMRSLGLPVAHEGTHTIRRAVARALFDSLDGDHGYDTALRTVSAFLHHKNSSTTEGYLGLSSERRRRDEKLRGKPFLSALVADAQVLPLRSVADDEGGGLQLGAGPTTVT